MPFIVILAITGSVYLFKDNVDSKKIEAIKQTALSNNNVVYSFDEQQKMLEKKLGKPLQKLVLPNNKNDITEFVIGKFGHKKSYYVNPHTNQFLGSFSPKDSWMYTIRKLHGELLTGSFGTKIVELIASWMVVLILTGLYIWFPFEKGIKGVFTIRFKEGKRILFRDLHVVLGFWFSIIYLLVLAGGFPWTDVFGKNYKKVQKLTNTGYPKTWNGKNFSSKKTTKKLSLDAIISIVKEQNLPGTVTIHLPKNETSVFSVSNNTLPLSNQQKLHFNQYSGELIHKNTWQDVGILMRTRMWLMTFHQGEFGNWNWWLMLLTGIALTVSSIAAIFSYLYRKSKNNWSIPKSPKQFKLGKGIIFVIVLFGIIFPLFGVSLVLILFYNFLTSFSHNFKKP